MHAATGRALRAMLALTLVAAPAAAKAQPRPRPLALGRAVRDSLTASDLTLTQRGAFHAYRVEVVAGTRYAVTMRSSDLDAFVWVARLVGGITDSIASNDDGGGTTDALLRFRARETGTYLVVAQAVEGPGRGSYEIRMDELPPSRPVTPVAIGIGTAREAALDERSPTLEEDAAERPYQLFTFTGRGQRLRIAVRSGAFDAAMRITRVTASGEEEIGTNDDGGGGSDAQMIITATGDYRLYAFAPGTGTTGAFTVAISEMPVRTVTSVALAVGQEVTGALESSDAETDDGRVFDQYTIAARPGERLVVTLRSSAFDALLEAGTLVANVLESMESDDDSGGGTDAKIEVTIPAAETFVIRAHALEPRGRGAYTIVVERRGE